MIHGDLHTKNVEYLREIKIGKRKYKIYTCDVLKINKRSYGGFIIYEDKEIYLIRGRDLEKKLIHELTHAFFHELSRVKNMKNKKMVKTLRGYEKFIEDIRYLIMQNFKLKKEIK